MFEYQGTIYNEKVMAALIESGMIKRLLGQKTVSKDWTKQGQDGQKIEKERRSREYPRFILKMMNNSKRTAILSACITQVIEVLTLFEKKKRQGISSE